jgi:DNA topoisomerase-1
MSEGAIHSARQLAQRLYGAEYVSKEPRRYQRKVRNAQEAHEAIRPAGDVFQMPDDIAGELSRDEGRLYELIWMRSVASQMADARGESAQVRLGAPTSDGREVEFAASGKIISFPGFLRAYVEGSDDPDAALEDREVRLPPLEEGQEIDLLSISPKEHSTQPPGRFTEASLVRQLEEMGVGRPSTYASIIGTIQDRGYVWKKGSALVPSFTAFSVTGLMESHFSRLVDFDFTAAMEEDLDEIATGEEEAIPWLKRFYFGNGGIGLQEMVSVNLDEIDAREVNSIPIGKDSKGSEIVARVGKYGPYLERGDERVSIPEDLPPDELDVATAVELLEAPSADRVLGRDPESGEDVHLKVGRYGPYVQRGEMDEDSKEKPPTASLLESMDPSSIKLEHALKLLALPRVVGKDPESDVEIEALNGRYGPYLRKGKETRSLDTEEQLFTVTLEEALALFAQPKQRGRRTSAPLKELGDDPSTGKPLVIKSGRYGPYVTDGEVNASVPNSETVEDMTLEHAVTLIEEKRKNPPKKRKNPPKKRRRK